MDKVTRPRDYNRCDIRLTALDGVVQSHQPRRAFASKTQVTGMVIAATERVETCSCMTPNGCGSHSAST